MAEPITTLSVATLRATLSLCDPLAKVAIDELARRAEANETCQRIVANVADSLERRAKEHGANPMFCENAARSLREALAVPAPPLAPAPESRERAEWARLRTRINTAFADNDTFRQVDEDLVDLRNAILHIARHVGLEPKEAT